MSKQNVNDFGHHYLPKDALASHATWRRLADSQGKSKYALAGSHNGLINGWRGPTAQLALRAWASFAEVENTTQLAKWAAWWGIVIGFLLIDRLAFMNTGTSAESEEFDINSVDDGLPTAEEAVDYATDIPNVGDSA